jgi:DNA-binding HxlR family transcriptional regulator
MELCHFDGQGEIRTGENILDILTICKHITGMILDLLKRPDYLRVLLAVQRKHLRFNQLQKSLRLNPTQVNRALNFLRKEFYIIPRTRPVEKSRIAVEYQLSKRGRAFLGSFKIFNAALHRKKDVLGRAEIAELQKLFRV